MSAARPLILLAPMEGLLDFALRDVLTRGGGIDRCVSEFIRVTDRLLPERAFTQSVPELLNGSCTPAGVPVRVQLLGSDVGCLAENAGLLATLSPAGIDLNFGCPAKTVNRHRGGAVLLDEPELIHAIVSAVRRAVPRGMAVSAKMRLGNQDDTRMLDCARAIADGGADELVVHARTKAHGYRPPAYWSSIAPIREAVGIPVVANGEIWSVADARRCQTESGCHALMLGRGMVADPGLACAVRNTTLLPHSSTASHVISPALQWPAVLLLLQDYWQQTATYVKPMHRAGLLKQWLHLLQRRHPEAQSLYQRVRPLHDPVLVEQSLATAFQ